MLLCFIIVGVELLGCVCCLMLLFVVVFYFVANVVVWRLLLFNVVVYCCVCCLPLFLSLSLSLCQLVNMFFFFPCLR